MWLNTWFVVGLWSYAVGPRGMDGERSRFSGGGVAGAWVRCHRFSSGSGYGIPGPIVTNGHQLGEIHRYQVKNLTNFCPLARFAPLISEPPLVLPSLVPIRTQVGENSCPWQKYSPFGCEPVRLRAGRWALTRLLPISTNGHRGRENGRHF